MEDNLGRAMYLLTSHDPNKPELSVHGVANLNLNGLMPYVIDDIDALLEESWKNLDDLTRDGKRDPEISEVSKKYLETVEKKFAHMAYPDINLPDPGEKPREFPYFLNKVLIDDKIDYLSDEEIDNIDNLLQKAGSAIDQRINEGTMDKNTENYFSKIESKFADKVYTELEKDYVLAGVTLPDAKKKPFESIVSAKESFGKTMNDLTIEQANELSKYVHLAGDTLTSNYLDGSMTMETYFRISDLADDLENMANEMVLIKTEDLLSKTIGDALKISGLSLPLPVRKRTKTLTGLAGIVPKEVNEIKDKYSLPGFPDTVGHPLYALKKSTKSKPLQAKYMPPDRSFAPKPFDYEEKVILNIPKLSPWLNERPLKTESLNSYKSIPKPFKEMYAKPIEQHTTLPSAYKPQENKIKKESFWQKAKKLKFW